MTALLALCGCATHAEIGDSTADAATSQDVIDLLRASASFDYEPHPSVAALADAVDIAAIGEVTGLRIDAVKQRGANFGVVLVTVEVRTQLKRHRRPKTFTVALPRPSSLDAVVYEQGLPAGTTIAVFGDKTTRELASEQPSSGPVVMSAPQGLFVEDRETRVLVDVWGDGFTKNPPASIDTADELTAAVHDSEPDRD